MGKRCGHVLMLTASLGAVWPAGVHAGKHFVRGGQFKDLILPVPIVDRLESEGLWGGPNVIPRDRDGGIEDNEWCYWGGNPIKDTDGKYHMLVCRWPERTGHGGWHDSEVAHCVSESPLGPYVLTETVVEKGHNPEVMAMPDGSYALHLADNRVFTAPRMGGPWTLLGRMRLDSRGMRPNHRLGSNLTTEFRPDGTILLMQKNGDMAISREGILGPYKMVSVENYSRATGYPEDPVIWRSRHQYHAVYNHAQDRKSAYMRSLDGIHWKWEEGLPYDASTTVYVDGTKNVWDKFERPKVVQDALGRAAYLSLAVIDVPKHLDVGGDNHSSKNIVLPLVVEKLVSIVPGQVIDATTRKIEVLIEAEDGFDPLAELDVDSLRFGSDSVVNYGGGCKAAQSVPRGKDLLVAFEGDPGLRHEDYDLKLLGQTKKGDLVFGYALLPARSPLAAALVHLPFTVRGEPGKQVLESTVENWGMESASPVTVAVYRHTRNETRAIGTATLPAIPAYGKADVSIDLPAAPAGAVEYELALFETNRRLIRWHQVDDTDPAVAFEGDWVLRDAVEDCFLKTEHASTAIGASVTYSFSGTRAMAYGRIGRQLGTFDVFIDGRFVEKVRCNWGSLLNAPIYQTGRLEPGRHTLRLVKSEGEYNGGIAVDAFSCQPEGME